MSICREDYIPVTSDCYSVYICADKKKYKTHTNDSRFTKPNIIKKEYIHMKKDKADDTKKKKEERTFFFSFLIFLPFSRQPPKAFSF